MTPRPAIDQLIQEQELDRTTAIRVFSGHYAWLSNMAPCPITFEGDAYASVEHAYQAAKALDPSDRQFIQLAPTGYAAKRRAKRLPCRPHWLDLRRGIMTELVRQKFTQEPFHSQLLSTGMRPLVETNWWYDYYWGVCNGQGLNVLGTILMDIRASLR